ncbi:hypothetical protein FOCC_FOCC012677 [Frankliniella occidentalis]|nr:hypothetical protein FOCC_FOCC012677 [Frankliniella occidentalis]
MATVRFNVVWEVRCIGTQEITGLSEGCSPKRACNNQSSSQSDHNHSSSPESNTSSRGNHEENDGGGNTESDIGLDEFAEQLQDGSRSPVGRNVGNEFDPTEIVQEGPINGNLPDDMNNEAGNSPRNVRPLRPDSGSPERDSEPSQSPNNNESESGSSHSVGREGDEDNREDGEEEGVEGNVEEDREWGGGGEGGGGGGDSGGDSESESARENEDSENEDSEHQESENQESDTDEEGFEHDNEPIYNGARLTFRESMLAILTFILSHKLTGLCVSDLLSLIELHCGANNLCLTTLYKFKKYFKIIGKRLITCHYYCSVCEVPLVDKNTVCRNCRGRHKVDYFIELPIVAQLQSMLKRQGFYESLQFRFNRQKKSVENMEDIYDGIEYQRLFRSGFLSNPNNLSFFMYFDGMSLFRTSSLQIWPIFLTINELRYVERTKKENVILAGIWFGKSKPNPSLFLKPISDSLKNLEENGVQMVLPNGQHISMKAKLIGATADMPAKSLFMRFIQFNGAFSCFSCMSQGGRFDLGNTTVQVFPYSRNFELRNNDDIPNYAEQALVARQVDNDASVYGIKGPSLLFSMLPNMISCMAIDIMHGGFLGVMKTLMNLWFDTQYLRFEFNISALVHVVDARLKLIKPPFSFNRVLKSIKKELSHFNAYDYKMFLFNYSLPVLLDILPLRYWHHHCHLVTAFALLSQNSISTEEIDQAEELLHTYVSDFQDLYGIRHLSLTFHQLLHMAKCVRNLGPSWVYSCFFYESLNGQFGRLVHGSRHVALQISSSCSVLMNLPTMLNAMTAGEAKTLCQKFDKSLKQHVQITEIIDDNTGVVGGHLVDIIVQLDVKIVL